MNGLYESVGSQIRKEDKQKHLKNAVLDWIIKKPLVKGGKRLKPTSPVDGKLVRK